MILRGLLETDSFVGGILNAMPLPVFVVDDDMGIIAYNQSASQFLGSDPQTVIRRRTGDVLHCVHSLETSDGCGRAPLCRDCVLRNAVGECLREGKAIRRKTLMEVVAKGIPARTIDLFVTAAPFEYQAGGYALLVLQDVTELVELRSIVPICSYCKRIRNDAQYWDSVELYIKTHIDVQFSHGICPECFEKVRLDRPGKDL